MPAVFFNSTYITSWSSRVDCLLKNKTEKKKTNKPVQDERKMMKEQEIKSDS